MGWGPPPANNRVCRLRPLRCLRCNPSPCLGSCGAGNRVAVELTLEREVVGTMPEYYFWPESSGRGRHIRLPLAKRPPSSGSIRWDRFSSRRTS